MFATCMLLGDSLLREIAKGTPMEAFANEVMLSINDPSKKRERSDLNQFSIRDGLLYRNNLLYVLEESCQSRVLHDCHDEPPSATLESQKHWSCYLKGFGGPNLGSS